VHELLPPAALLGDEPGPLQHGDVLLHGREAHRVGLRESRDRGLAGGAAAQDVAARRVRQGTEQLVDRLVRQFIYNHPVVDYPDMKLTTITHISVDGVMQGLGGQDEDRSGGFERGGWAIPLFDDEAETFTSEAFQRADAFLLGRRTYEIFAGSWGTGSWGENQGDNPISVALNTKPKYVASSTLTEPEWDGTTVLSDDVAAAVAELKAKPEGELQVHGSGALIRSLMDNDLVDEINLLTYPVVIGQGTRLFPDTGPDRALELIESQTTAGGVIIQVYRPAGRPQYAT
jgi:dihydrofolate reductase